MDFSNDGQVKVNRIVLLGAAGNRKEDA